jgi:hypothetical protein
MVAVDCHVFSRSVDSLLTAFLCLKREVPTTSGAWLQVAAYFRQQQPLVIFSCSSIGQWLRRHEGIRRSIIDNGIIDEL